MGKKKIKKKKWVQPDLLHAPAQDPWSARSQPAQVFTPPGKQKVSSRKNPSPPCEVTSPEAESGQIPQRKLNTS